MTATSNTARTALIATITRHASPSGPVSAEELTAAIDSHAAEVRAAALNDAERQFLGFALDLAADQMAMHDGFTDEDDASLESLRRMTAGRTDDTTIADGGVA